MELLTFLGFSWRVGVNGCPPIIIVFFPTKGTALATAALARQFKVPPRIVLASEIREEDITDRRRVIFLDYLVAVANSSPVPEFLELARNLSEWGAEVLWYREYKLKINPKKAANSTKLEDLIEQAVSPDFTLPRTPRGYERIILDASWADKAADEVSRQLLEDGTRFDMQGDASGFLVRNELKSFSASPDGFRSFVLEVITLGDFMLAE